MNLIRSGQKRVRLLVHYVNGTETWQDHDAVRLHDPLSLTLYVYSNGLQENSCFAWTKMYAKEHHEDGQSLRAMINAARTSYRQPKLKFGVEVPKSVSHAAWLDRRNGNHLWRDSTQKEIDQICEYETFRVLEDDKEMPDGYELIPYHIVYDVKYDGRRKARLVADGNHTTASKEEVYSGVVGIETVRLGFMIAALNNL